MWAHPANEMNSIWVGERVATIKFEDILSNVIQRRDAPAWGPNAQFRYPMNGTGQSRTPRPLPLTVTATPTPKPGTGQIWVKIFESLPAAHKRLNARMVKVRTAEGQKPNPNPNLNPSPSP